MNPDTEKEPVKDVLVTIRLTTGMLADFLDGFSKTQPSWRINYVEFPSGRSRPGVMELRISIYPPDNNLRRYVFTQEMDYAGNYYTVAHTIFSQESGALETYLNYDHPSHNHSNFPELFVKFLLGKLYPQK